MEKRNFGNYAITNDLSKLSDAEILALYKNILKKHKLHAQWHEFNFFKLVERVIEIKISKQKSQKRMNYDKMLDYMHSLQKLYLIKTNKVMLSGEQCEKIYRSTASIEHLKQIYYLM